MKLLIFEINSASKIRGRFKIPSTANNFMENEDMKMISELGERP